MSKASSVIHLLSRMDLPSDLYHTLVQAVRDYPWDNVENVCFNCQGSGTSRYSLRLCTACNGTGILPEHVKP